jgi:predicted small lipoprotein YifL
MHCWARYFFIAVVSVLGIGQMMAACGQKGDLYLPEPEKPAAKAKPAGTQVPPPANPDKAKGP